MKKSIKKACSIALLLTSTVALTGANALIVDKVTDNANAQIFAEQKQNTLTMLNLPAYVDTVSLGETYPIPTPTLTVNGSDVTTSAKIETVVKDSIGRVVDQKGGKFVVDGIGQYTITYNVAYEGKTYSTSITIESSVSENSIEFVENTIRTLPGDVYASYEGSIYIPEAKVVFADKTLQQEADFVITVTSPSQENVTFDEDGLLDPNYQLSPGTYSVKYTAYKKGTNIYLNSTTKEFTVLSDDDFITKYGSLDYKLSFDFSSTAPTTADIGEELVLPEAIGRIGDQETPIYYTVTANVYIGDRPYDVTDETISVNEDGRYVFTAQKKYTINDVEQTVTNGRYQFNYIVKDTLGKDAEQTGFVISGVKDTQRPTITLTDGYSIDSALEAVEDKSYELQNNFSGGQNIVIKAAYAEDLSDDFADLKIERFIRTSDQSSSQDDVYSDEDSDVENAFTKDIVFNKADDYVLKENEIDGGTLKDGTYTVYYRATDSAGNTETINYKFVVSRTFEFESKTSVEFQDTFPVSINRGESVTFTAPVATNDDDERLQTLIYYKFDNSQGTGKDAWTLLEANEDGKYVVPTDVEGAKTLTIRAMAISDAPKTELETPVDESFNITDYEGLKYGFDEVSISIRDNQDSRAPEIISLGDLKPQYTQNEDIVLPSITVSDDLVNYVNLDVKISHVSETDGETQPFYAEINQAPSLTIEGYKMFDGLSFYANLAGRYDIVYEITDAANNKVCVYQTINVDATTTSSQPHFGNLPESLNGGKVELGESLTLPIPELPEGEYDYTVGAYGAVGSQVNKETFTPKTEGTYTIVYSLYHKDTPSVIEDKKEFTVQVSDTTGPQVLVEWNLEPSYAKGSNVTIPVFTANDVSGINLKDSTIVIKSNSITRTIYGNEIAEEFKKGENGRLYMPLDFDEIYTVTYTVYDNSDAKNSTVVTKTIRVGDLVSPTVVLPDNMVPTTVKIDTPIKFNIADLIKQGLKVTDTNGAGESVEYDQDKIIDKLNITVQGPNGAVENTSTDEDGNLIDGEFEFFIDAAGSYTVTITVEDDSDNVTTIPRTFTVTESAVTPLSDNEIITIVLICVAVLVLAGAVVYAIISSKNTKAYKQ